LDCGLEIVWTAAKLGDDVSDEPQVFEEIESWPAKKRMSLIKNLLERECSHGDHPKELKDHMTRLGFQMWKREQEQEGYEVVVPEPGDEESIAHGFAGGIAVQKVLERPWWVGKDVVGVLSERGWSASNAGMIKKGPGMLTSLFIPAKDIIECGDHPSVGADRLEAEAEKRREHP
jgi:hypothetical protein